MKTLFLAGMISLNLYGCSDCGGACSCGVDYTQFEDSSLESIYSNVSKYVHTDIDKAVAYYRQAESIDPNFPTVVEFEDGSFMLTDPTHIFDNESLRQKYVDILIRYEILEDQEDVAFTQDGVYVTPKCVKKKAFLSEAQKIGAKIIATR